ncbi:MFS transporter [Streptomyces bambusae]|uniref:MFS transporter n=1 Tax=Streptomyces bambusae TaxID=1550616 RepID=UPI001CFCD670|nr:MFS transporter [Streptomyces bambusae]MCB5165829.1 MFS transporter [Streptomyces bambusae]
MTGSLDARTAVRRYATACALFWLPLGLTIAPLVLLLTERGLSVATIAGVVAVHSLTAAALELPTGGLSDVIGRRAVLAAAGACNVLALGLQAVGTSVWTITVGAALMGAGRALSSGPAEAWYVDTVQAHSGPEADLRAGLARGSATTSAALAAGTLLGGALPWLLGLGPDLGARLTAGTSGTVLPLSVPLLLGAAVEVVFVGYVLVALREPPRPSAALQSMLRGIPGTIADGLRLGGRDALVRRILLTAGAAGGALAALELLTPGRAAALTGAPDSGAVLFAGLACTGFACSAAGSHFAPLAARFAGGGERAVLLALGTSTTGLLILGATAAVAGTVSAVVAVAGYALVYVGLGAAGPNENDLLHRRVSDAGRATALSVQSLALQLVGALTGLLVGALPTGPAPWLVGGAVLLAGTLLWAGRTTAPPAAPADTAQPQPAEAGTAG